MPASVGLWSGTLDAATLNCSGYVVYVVQPSWISWSFFNYSGVTLKLQWSKQMLFSPPCNGRGRRPSGLLWHRAFSCFVWRQILTMWVSDPCRYFLCHCRSKCLGKTTLARLIEAWDVWIQARSRLGGRDVRDYKVDALLQNFLLFSREAFLLDDTIENNIKLGNPDANSWASSWRGSACLLRLEFIQALAWRIRNTRLEKVVRCLWRAPTSFYCALS